MNPVIDIRELRFRYPESAFELKMDSFSLSKGDSLAITGASGSGKTTLLNLISGLVTPTKGSLTIDGNEMSQLSDAERRNFRIRNIGFIFQDFALLEYLNALENVLLPYYVNRSLKLNKATKGRACDLLASVGLTSSQVRQKVGKLSQGERQRVAICRALVTDASILIADEPTGNLDPQNTNIILDLLFQHQKQEKKTLVVVTHDHQILDRFDQQFILG